MVVHVRSSKRRMIRKRVNPFFLILISFVTKQLLLSKELIQFDFNNVELKSALQNSHGLKIHLIGDMALTKIYGDAISEFGRTVIQVDTDIVTAGYYALLKQIAEHAE